MQAQESTLVAALIYDTACIQHRSSKEKGNIATRRISKLPQELKSRGVPCRHNQRSSSTATSDACKLYTCCTTQHRYPSTHDQIQKQQPHGYIVDGNTSQASSTGPAFTAGELTSLTREDNQKTTSLLSVPCVTQDTP